MNKCIVVFLLFVSMSMKDRFAAFSSGYDDDDDEVEESCVLNSAIVEMSLQILIVVGDPLSFVYVYQVYSSVHLCLILCLQPFLQCSWYTSYFLQNPHARVSSVYFTHFMKLDIFSNFLNVFLLHVCHFFRFLSSCSYIF